MKNSYSFFYYRVLRKGSNIYILIDEDIADFLEMVQVVVLKRIEKEDINVLDLYALLKTIKSEINSYAQANFKHSYSEGVIEVLAWNLLFKLFGIDIIFPIIIDPYIQEVYLAQEKAIYVDHLLWGRINVKLHASKEFLGSLIYFLKLYANLILIGDNPSAKVYFNVFDSYLRISIDISEGVIFIDIRKAKSIMPVAMLLLNNDAPEILLWLSALLIARPNVIIFGETGSGKTTLAKLLLSLLPSNWRLAIVEDVTEIPTSILNCKFFRIIVDPYEIRLYEKKVGYLRKKSKEILKLLHRMPDYLYVSEIQDYDDSWALMQIFSAGLKGLATTHATSLDGLIRRLCNVYKIDPELISLVDIFIETKRVITRNTISRLVNSVYIVFGEDNIDSVVTKISLAKRLCGKWKINILPINFNEHKSSSDVLSAIFEYFIKKAYNVVPERINIILNRYIDKGLEIINRYKTKIIYRGVLNSNINSLSQMFLELQQLQEELYTMLTAK